MATLAPSSCDLRVSMAHMQIALCVLASLIPIIKCMEKQTIEGRYQAYPADPVDGPECLYSLGEKPEEGLPRG